MVNLSRRKGMASPSVGIRLNWYSYTPYIFSLFLLVRVASGHQWDHPRSFADGSFFTTAHVFDTAPGEGITLLSTTTTFEAFLVDGETEEIIYNYAFMPPTGSALTDYSTSFSCNNALIYDSSSCIITNVETAITDSTDTALNTTVACSFNLFPGNAECTLFATSTAATSQFTSPSVTANIYGYVFYIPDSSGLLSAGATIVSGSSNSYNLPSYDRLDAGVREIESYAFIPESAASEGSFDFLERATFSYSSTDVILNYDVTSCSFSGGAASFQADGTLNLADSDVCGMGLAVKDTSSFPTLGVQFRPYKSGSFTFQLSWAAFGTSDQDYSQTVTLQISERAPPVILEIRKLDEYRSTPCEDQFLNMTVTNVRLASLRQLQVFNEDESTTAWSEISSFYSYNSDDDISTVVFESAGGLGTDVSFNFFATVEESPLSGVELIGGIESTENLVLSFSSPPVLTSMTPSTSQLSGGDVITLVGSFNGFGNSGAVFVGGYRIDSSQLSLTGSSQISFAAPAQELIGNQFTYDVTVGFCAEKSNAISLNYIVQPLVSIVAIRAIVDEATSVFTLPLDSNATFIADVTGSSVGILYSWTIFASDGTEISLGDSIATDSPRFDFSPSLLSGSETYVLNATVTSFAGLSDTETITIQLAEENTDFILVQVYSPGKLYKSFNSPTLVQSTLKSSSLSAVTLVWQYRNQSFLATAYDPNSTTTLDTSVTGPTKLGLEFFIARTDLFVGNSTLSVTASLNSDASVTDTDNTTIQVISSDLQSIINNGINGTLIQSLDDISLTGVNSRDPDVLKDDGDDTAGITYLWSQCSKSLDSNFLVDVEECSSLLSTDQTVQSFNISSESLLAERIDNQTDPDPTYFSFGLQVSKDMRTDLAFIYFEFRTVQTSERVPTLNSIDVVDSRGNILGNDGLSPASDILIRPVAAESIVVWTFDMVYPRQRYFFGRTDIIITGPGFMSVRNQKSRLFLGFAAGSLAPSTEYLVSVVASANDTSLETSHQVMFKTSELPQLTCLGPDFNQGIVSETNIFIFAESFYDPQNVEYCFSLISESRERFLVGKGCSSVAFASFTFPREGVYDIECLAKTSSGSVLQNVTLDANITLSYPEQDVSLSEVEILSQRLTNLTELVDRCEALRDHSCISFIIIATSDLSFQIEAAVVTDTSDDGIQLQEDVKAFVIRLSELSDELASSTVYRPNLVEGAVDETFVLSTISSVYLDESTLYKALSQMNGAITTIRENDAVSVRSNTLVYKAIAVANVTISNAYRIADQGTTRRRLLQDGVERVAYADLLIRSLGYVADVRRQQEGCGYIGRESTSYPTTLIRQVSTRSATLSVLQPCSVNVIIACNVEQIQETFGEFVQVELCATVIKPSQLNRIEGLVTEIPTNNVLKTGMVSNLDVYTKDMVHVKVIGIDGVPAQCITLTFRRDQSTLEVTEFDELESGLLTPTSTISGRGCTGTTCYNFITSLSNTNQFGSLFVTVSTSKQGLITAGNVSRILNFGLISVVNGDLTVLSRVLMITSTFVAFAVIAGVATWFMLTRGVVAYPEVDDLGWEYVERDMFGRGSVETTNFSPVANAQENAIGSTFTNMANRQSMERKVSSRAMAQNTEL